MTFQANVYVPSAPRPDIMRDQLEYLLNHQRGDSCPDDCMDCVRLLQVDCWLLLPFRTKRTRKTKAA